MHPLFGPIKKHDRATERFRTLEREVEDFIERDRYGITVSEFDAKTGKNTLRILSTSDAQPPLRWSVDIGEIAFNLRSALDQAATQLALATNPPSNALLRTTQFPICLYGPSSAKPKSLRWRDGMLSISFISRKHRELLQRMQPYSRRDRERPLFGPFKGRVPSGRIHPLWLLHEVNNADKHRLLQSIARVARGWSLSVRTAPKDFDIKSLHAKSGMKIVHGTRIGSMEVVGPREGVDMKLRLNPEVVFWEGCDAVKGLPVIRTLEGMVHETDNILIKLAAEFPPLDPPWGPPD